MPGFEDYLPAEPLVVRETAAPLRVGVFIDVSSIERNGGYGMRYDVLRHFAARDGAQVVRLNAYAGIDADRCAQDLAYAKRMDGYYGALRELGYKVLPFPRVGGAEERDESFCSHAGIALAVDVMQQLDAFHRVLLVAGDGSYTPLVQAVQAAGRRIDLLAFEGLDQGLRLSADLFTSGYLVPNLLPVDHSLCGRVAWGEFGSRVRGICSHYDAEKGFGFMRFQRCIDANLWITDTRRSDSPHGAAFFKTSQLPLEASRDALPDRNQFFEFTLEESASGEQPQATQIRLAGSVHTG